MLSILLQAYAFKNRGLLYSGRSIKYNYILVDYNPHIKQMVVDAPKNDSDSFIFQHADKKIQDLSIYGDFGPAKLTALVWNNRQLRLFNVLLEMNTTSGATFAISNRSFSIYVYSSFFDVGNAVIKMDSALKTSITSTTFVGKYILVGGRPMSTYIRGDAFYTRTQALATSPAEYQETCRSCPAGSSGDGCAICADGTYINEEQCLADSTKCLCQCNYDNQIYSVFQSTCSGSAIQYTDMIEGSDNTLYYTECINHKSMYIYYYNVTSTHAITKKIRVFKDDSCGLNNIQLDLTMRTYTLTDSASQVTGLTEMMTQDVSYLNLSINMTNSGQKMYKSSMMFFSANKDKSYKFQNIYMRGQFLESGTGRNYSEEYHMNGMFQDLEDVNMTIYNVSIQGIKFYNFWDGTFNSFGIGTISNVTFDISYLYIGANKTDSPNPIFDVSTEEYNLPSFDCSDKLDADAAICYALLTELPPQLLSSTKMEMDADAGPKQACFVGKMTDSYVNMKMSSLAFLDTDNYAQSIEIGIIATEVYSTTIITSRCVFQMQTQLYGPVGVIGYMSGVANSISINAAVNITATRTIGGVIGQMDGGSASFNVYINMTYSTTQTGGLFGILNGGSVTITGAHGKVVYGKPVVGDFQGGQIGENSCSDPPCTFDTYTNSYINVKNNADGICGGASVTSDDLQGDATESYFADCASNIKVKINYEGEPSGNISVMKSGCELVNVRVQAKFILSPAATINVSGLVKVNYYNVSQIVIDLNCSHETGHIYALGFFSVNATGTTSTATTITFTNMTFRGVFMQDATSTSLQRAACLAPFAQGTIIADQIQILGVQMTFYRAYRVGYIFGYCAGNDTITNVRIDNNASSNVQPSFSTVTETTTFPCPSVMDTQSHTATYFKQLLNSGQIPSFIKQIYITSTYVGGLIGQQSAAVIFTNVTANISAYLQATTSYYLGALFGSPYSNSLYVNQTFVTGESKIIGGSLIGYGWTNYYLNITLEYTFKHEQSSFMYKSTSSSYKQYVNLLLNVTLSAENTAAFTYTAVTAFNELNLGGIVVKDGCTNCYNYCAASGIDTVPASYGSQSISSDRSTCPPALDLS